MRRSYLFLFVLFLVAKSGLSDDTTNVSISSGKIPQAGFVFNLNDCFLKNHPKDMGLRGFSPGADVYLFYNYSIAKGLCFSIGAGLSSLNYNYNISPLNYNIDATGNTTLVKIPDSINYLTNKLSVTYFDIPIELKYFYNTNKISNSLKMAIGFKVGYLFDSHTKYKNRFNEITTTSKINKIKNIERFRYGITARISKGPIGLYGYYAFSTLFTKKVLMNGEKIGDLSAFTVGLSLSLF